MEIIYRAKDGILFDSQKDCLEYEQKLLTAHREGVQRAMCGLDVAIWEKYYPDSAESSAPDPLAAGMWLRADIAHILSDDAIDSAVAEQEIVSMIKANNYGAEILNMHVSMDAVRKEVAIRKDFEAAFNKGMDNHDIASTLNYRFSKTDLRRLATLHKAGKYQSKIELLLTSCNYYYECGQFCRKKYAEFLN